MKIIIYYFLNKMFGKKKHQRLFLILKNIGIQGMNYKNTEIEKNGELNLINKISIYYKDLPNLILFDIGANIGNYSTVLAQKFTNNPKIFAFEPFSFPFKTLNNLSEIHSTILPFHFGFSDKEEKLIMFTSEGCSEIGGVYNRDFIFEDLQHNVQEESFFTTLDLFTNKHQISKINFLKIDVEGHEFAVLSGGKHLIETGKIDFIQFEFGAGNHFSRTFFMDFYNLLSPNYNLYRLLQDGLERVTNYNSEIEIQTLCYYVAINKSINHSF